ncbi:cytochrome C assembly family protein [Ideonella benzenivorans]|uniref:cytochrome C assembly family protein n=1 Tax=Ideonella benzenivorans TaxID=2831643 RepID=UPI001CEE07C6|nr:cytochrome c biogenesis protein CcsA [Ideonella benzenivorans]
MILAVDPPAASTTLATVLTVAIYLAAALPAGMDRRWPLQALVAAWGLQALVLISDALPEGGVPGLRIGFAPVLSLTVWLVLAIHGLESRMLPVPRLRRTLASAGAVAVALAWVFPGELHVVAHSRWAPLHWLLGLCSYGLFGAAVLHALLLDNAERRMRRGAGTGSGAFGVPLMRLEHLTFRFVEAGFAVLTLALVLGLSSAYWRWDHKTVLSLLGWATLAALLIGRRVRGWRGHLATRWLYAGALLLLLAYVGSRFVLEVVLQRAAN